jgi:hypothetical protein
MQSKGMTMIVPLLAIALLIAAAGSLCLITGYQARAAAAEMFVYLGVVSVLRPTNRGKATSRRASRINRLENRFT